ncbi:ABC transporter ATP-binding protein [Maribacter cobaltidurans]|uniref:ABC transporter ATP-binding protein n=1 Tax=Maribacter cobaltidurans TaxID=1178778 RepID=A0A223V925_9FLAO|nr:ABC transporter ATP-binding protein [Maribacter cobaltidurans]ASV31903.1 ABC transporter ATP-binding protein [Maribacter cobaltidurans]GGD85536.1 ABC transporter ATP-binding protein [Maribacter cobaltidurans]
MDITNPEKEHTILEIDNLTIGYENKKVCSAISFAVKRGECAAIVGVNGIGKSTLLRTIGHLQPALGGTIRIDGTLISQMSMNNLAKRLSLVLTEPIASKNMTVKELIALGRQPYTNWMGSLGEMDIKKISEAISMLELNHLADTKCYELSDGQLQRVMIARALAQDTDIILLDEPTTHLDLFHKVQILKLLKSIAHQTKKTVLFTSHEIEIAIQLCDKILILEGDKNPFDEPCKLIENKAFERLFPLDTIRFDATTGTFCIQK